jgi:hypothetical protein
VKHISILLILCVLMIVFPLSSFAETDTPYPPPAPAGTNTGSGPQVKLFNPSPDDMLADVILVRPASIAAYVIGIGAAVLATPFAAITGTTQQVYKRLLDDPFDFAIRRPLGEY